MAAEHTWGPHGTTAEVRKSLSLVSALHETAGLGSAKGPPRGVWSSRERPGSGSVRAQDSWWKLGIK